MSSKMNRFFLAGILLSACFVDVHAVRCYECFYTDSSELQPSGVTESPEVAAKAEGCNDPFDATAAGAQIRECDGSCLKATSEKNGVVVSIQRTCFPANDQSSCNSLGCVNNMGANTCSHCCDTDLCNGASSVTFNLSFMITMAAILVFTLCA